MSGTVRHSTLPTWLKWQEGLHPTEIELGLDRVRSVAERLGLLETTAKVITVAGTNGKGSCIAALGALLKAQGFSVGAYTSPHLFRYNERILLQGQPAADDLICEAFAAIDEARGSISLSYFEFGTLAALFVFSRSHLDFWLLEVGLGGRLDAVNIVDPTLAIITSIALDHEAWLGDNREDIGREKAGICRSSARLICADPEPPVSIATVVDRLGCEADWLNGTFSFHSEVNADTGVECVTFSLQVNTQESESVLRTFIFPRQGLHLPLPSLAAAMQVCARLNVLPDIATMTQALAESQLPGRYQRMDIKGHTVIFDVAHNPAAIELLRARVQSDYPDQDLVVVLGMLSDKKHAEALSPFGSGVKKWYVAPLNTTPRTATAKSLSEALVGLGYTEQTINISGNLAEALTQAMVDVGSNGKPCEAAEAPIVLVTGSFFAVSEGLAFIEHQLGESCTQLPLK